MPDVVHMLKNILGDLFIHRMVEPLQQYAHAHTDTHTHFRTSKICCLNTQMWECGSELGGKHKCLQ